MVNTGYLHDSSSQDYYGWWMWIGISVKLILSYRPLAAQIQILIYSPINKTPRKAASPQSSVWPLVCIFGMFIIHLSLI